MVQSRSLRGSDRAFQRPANLVHNKYKRSDDPEPATPDGNLAASVRNAAHQREEKHAEILGGTLRCSRAEPCRLAATTRFRGTDELIKSSWSEVLNQYQRRADLIPNLVNTVKGFRRPRKKKVLLGVTNARAKGRRAIQATRS